MIKEGLLDEKGKPNDKTPKDWFKSYTSFSHYGEKSGTNNGNVTSEPLASQITDESFINTSIVKTEPKDSNEETGDEPEKKKKKKDKKKKEKEDDE